MLLLSYVNQCINAVHAGSILLQSYEIKQNTIIVCAECFLNEEVTDVVLYKKSMSLIIIVFKLGFCCAQNCPVLLILPFYFVEMLV